MRGLGQSAAEEREQFSKLFQANYARVQAFAARRVGRDLAGTRYRRVRLFLVVAFGTSSYGQVRNEITVNG